LGFVSGGRHRSADEIQARTLRGVSVLAAAGVGEGDRVAVMLRNDFPFIEASYAAQVLGAIAVPVNWHYGEDEAGYILRDSGAKVLVVHADLIDQLGDAIPVGTVVLVVATPQEVAAAYGLAPAPVPPHATGWDEALAGAEPWSEPPRPSPPSMIYTSGTTGRPKAVQRLHPLDLTDADMLAALAVVGIGPGMRTVVCGPMYHTAPNVHALLAGRVGGLVVLQPRFDAEELLALIDRHAITALHLVPTMLVRLLRLPDATRARYDTSSLRVVAHAAAPCPPDVKRAAIAWLGPIVNEYYGATETGAVVGCTSDEWLAHPGTVGSALPGCDVRIVGEDGRDLPAGEPGDVYLRSEPFGDFTYHGRDDERRKIELDGYVTVGDLGYLDDSGYLFLCDRREELIISGGVNIYPAEIEAALIAHPLVGDCAVFGIPDAEFGEVIAAVVQPVPGAAPAPDEIKAHVRRRLAGFKVPRVVELASELPREDSGKIFKRRLRERCRPPRSPG
jgi:long-chain acyl-CoA synthetase